MDLKPCPKYTINYGMIPDEDIEAILNWAVESIKEAPDNETIRNVLNEIWQIGWEEGSASKEAEHEENEFLDEDVEIHDNLNPKIWNEDKELIPEVRAKILQIVDKFKSLLALDGVDLKVEDIYILGSNANFNYNEDSDLDIHIIADESFDCSNEHLKIIYDAYKSLFNNKYDITIKGINAEIYVENKNSPTNRSAGVYSLNNGWLKDPAQYEVPEINQTEVDKGVQFWEDRYYDVVENPSIKKIDDFLDDIHAFRKEALYGENGGEFNQNNLVFKEIRRLGYLNDLKNLKTELTSKELSLEALEEESKDKVKIRFHYRGPVKHFEKVISNDWEDYTEAVTWEEALRNLTSKAKKKLGYEQWVRLTLNPNYLEISAKNIEPNEEPIEERPLCPKCKKIHLNDSDECPLCDLHDESVLEEEFKTKLYEGCWGMPNTLAEVNKLKNLMMKPIDAWEIGDQVKSKNDELGIGDDTLFDNIAKYRKEHGYGSKACNDVRKVVQDFIKDEVLPNWDSYSYSQPEGNHDGEVWEDGVKEVFQEIADLNLKELQKQYKKEVEEKQKKLANTSEDAPTKESLNKDFLK